MISYALKKEKEGNIGIGKWPSLQKQDSLKESGLQDASDKLALVGKDSKFEPLSLISVSSSGNSYLVELKREEDKSRYYVMKVLHSSKF